MIYVPFNASDFSLIYKITFFKKTKYIIDLWKYFNINIIFNDFESIIWTLKLDIPMSHEVFCINPVDSLKPVY
jgi:hypothetical protein